MAVDIGGSLTRKLGPLPAWGWGVAIGGAYLGVKMLRGGGGGFAGGKDTQIVTVPTGPIPVSPNFTDELSEAVFQLNRRIDELQQDSNNNIDDGEQMPGPSPTPPAVVAPKPPIYNPLMAPTWGQRARSIVDNAFSNVVGRGPSTGAERDPWLLRIQHYLNTGVSETEAYNRIASTIAPFRQSALAGNPVPPPEAF